MSGPSGQRLDAGGEPQAPVLLTNWGTVFSFFDAFLPQATFSNVYATTTYQGDWNGLTVIIYIQNLMDF